MLKLDKYVESIKNKSVAVIGAGVSNMPLIRLLCRSGCDVTVCDKRQIDQMGEDGAELVSLGAKLRLGDDYLENLHEDIVFRTPGLMPFDEHLTSAKAQGSLITSEMELFFALCPCRIIAVTGSDGKTTTTTIISELLKAAGRKVHLGGNIGRPLLCDTPEMKADDIAVLELSSFQLHSMNCHPNVAVVTNISPNHLDKHKDYHDYIDAKKAIFEKQTGDDRLVLNLDDGMTDYYLESANANVSFFSDKRAVDNGVMCENGIIYRVHNGERSELMKAGDIKLPGEHNVLNYMAAFAATEGLVSDDICREVAMSFNGVEHRLELVRELDGVIYINDSIGTSPTRTIAGLNAMKVKPIVILGGYDKHIPFDGLGVELCKKAKRAILTGDTAWKIREAIEKAPDYLTSGLIVETLDDFTEAVEHARAVAAHGDIVLLSPACAAFDRFKNFAERGKCFKRIVMEFKEK